LLIRYSVNLMICLKDNWARNRAQGHEAETR
jgi:hypothetical protein